MSILQDSFPGFSKNEQELEMVAASLQSGDLVTQSLAHATRQVGISNMEL
jgi:hypothetical protein